jgi:hypothetical protein
MLDGDEDRDRHRRFLIVRRGVPDRIHGLLKPQVTPLDRIDLSENGSILIHGRKQAA